MWISELEKLLSYYGWLNIPSGIMLLSSGFYQATTSDKWVRWLIVSVIGLVLTVLGVIALLIR